MSVSRNRMSTEGQLSQLKTDTSESVGELRDFLSKMRGKSPQEVLGAVANSGLVGSTLVSAAVVGVLLFGLSLAAWTMRGPEPNQAAANTPAADSTAEAPAEDAAAQPDATSAAGDAAATPGEEGVASGDATLDRLGIGETKAAPPGENPLEKNLDNLLDDFK